jgi:hypothetical protein
MYFYVACSYEGGMQVEDPCRIKSGGKKDGGN